MPEWLYEAGIGENRAILIQDDAILEAAIELPGEMSVGTVASGRLSAILIPGRRGIVTTAGGDILVEPLAPPLTQGQKVRVEIVREAIAEAGKFKVARGRITEEPERDGPTLEQRLGQFASLTALGPDRFEQAGWSELLEEAISGEIFFPGGKLRMSLTPAMTLFDVDGSLLPADLAIAGAAAAGWAIRRFGIGGSIGIHLPTLVSKVERQRAASAIDAVLPQPFERTSVNGFGFLQIVRRRQRSSVPELLQFDAIGASARMLLRRAERYPGVGVRHLIAAPSVIARLEANRHWLEELMRRTGWGVSLQADASLTTFGGHVQSVVNQ